MTATAANIAVKTPVTEFDLATRGATDPFHESWYLKLNSTDSQHALWIRITLLVSGNGFRRVAETWAIYAHRSDSREVTQVALKQSHDISTFVPWREKDDTLKVGSSTLGMNRSQGQLQSKGHSISWDLRFEPANAASFPLVPRALDRFGVLGAHVETLAGDLRFSGSCTVDGEEVQWKQAPGMLGHSSGTHHAHSWIWGHSNVFVDDRGQPVDFVFEGLSARSRLFGILPSPRLSCFYFHYKGTSYLFNSLWDALRVRSRNTFTEWRFQADRGPLSFRGRSTAEHRDFAGLTIEDTNGALLYGANSKLSNLEVHVYRGGKLEAAFYSNGTASIEVVSPQKNPYVPQLL